MRGRVGSSVYPCEWRATDHGSEEPAHRILQPKGDEVKLVIFGFLLGWWPQYVAISLAFFLLRGIFQLVRWAYWQANDWYHYSHYQL
jgi:hypothetical protein